MIRAILLACLLSPNPAPDWSVKVDTHVINWTATAWRQVRDNSPNGDARSKREKEGTYQRIQGPSLTLVESGYPNGGGVFHLSITQWYIKSYEKDVAYIQVYSPHFRNLFLFFVGTEKDLATR